MIVLNEKELKLLYALDINCRQSAKELAKVSGFTPSFVIQKIKDLENEGIINGFTAQINPKKFDFISYRINIFFQNINPETLERILQRLEETKEIFCIELLDKNFGISIRYIAKDKSTMHKFLLMLKENYNDIIKHQEIIEIEERQEFPCAFFLKKAFDHSNKFFKEDNTKKSVFDKLDSEILNILSRDARTSLIKISELTNTPPRTIRYRLTRLEKEKVILRYKVKINKDLIGYKRFKLRFETNASLNKIINFVQTNPHIVCFEYGSVFDYELTIETESIDGLMGVIKNIQEIFAPLKSYNYDYIMSTRKDVGFKPI